MHQRLLSLKHKRTLAVSTFLVLLTCTTQFDWAFDFLQGLRKEEAGALLVSSMFNGPSLLQCWQWLFKMRSPEARTLASNKLVLALQLP